MLVALGINENLNVSELQYGTWNIILLQRPWGFTGLKRVLGISIKLLSILYIMMILDFFLLSAKLSHPNHCPLLTAACPEAC